MTDSLGPDPGCSADKCPCEEECPLMRVMGMIGGKWKIAILCALKTDGPLRYNALKRRTKGITNTMLAGALRELEGAGLVLRTQYMEMPLRVEYALTAKCDGLMPILGQMANWGKRTHT